MKNGKARHDRRRFDQGQDDRAARAGSRRPYARSARSCRRWNPKTAPNPDGNAEKDPGDWVSGDDPMTGAQASYLKTLSEETGIAAYRDDLSKAEASVLIDELKTSRDRSR
ncbi:DUF3072 domain-containing protein [Methylopila sp. M107]|uniref:DUF3072 domain-containing protein n=1 Tax=Methylopila sp. M107 TaxID=1101190 RepID=UPI00039E10E3